MVTRYFTPMLCSSAMLAGYNKGTQDAPQWVYVGATGEPFLEFHAQKILRTGLISISEEGIFTKEQRQEMEEISQRGSATKQILNHIAMRGQSNKRTFSSRMFDPESPSLNSILQQPYEAAYTEA